MVSPTPSTASQMSGTSSIRTQCSWMFCRSVRSAVSRAYFVETSPMVRSACGGQLPAVDPDPHHEVLVLELLRLQDRGAAAVDAGRALGVQAPPAEPAAQVARVDAVEAGVAVAVLDPRAARAGRRRPSSSARWRSAAPGGRAPTGPARAASGRARRGRSRRRRAGAAGCGRRAGRRPPTAGRRRSNAQRDRLRSGCRAERWARGSLRTGREPSHQHEEPAAGSARRHRQPGASERRVSGGGTTGSAGDAHEVNLAAAHQKHSLGRHRQIIPWYRLHPCRFDRSGIDRRRHPRCLYAHPRQERRAPDRGAGPRRFVCSAP